MGVHEDRPITRGVGGESADVIETVCHRGHRAFDRSGPLRSRPGPTISSRMDQSVPSTSSSYLHSGLGGGRTPCSGFLGPVDNGGLMSSAGPRGAPEPDEEAPGSVRVGAAPAGTRTCAVPSSAATASTYLRSARGRRTAGLRSCAASRQSQRSSPRPRHGRPADGEPVLDRSRCRVGAQHRVDLEAIGVA